MKIHYRRYCKILKDVIREAKKQYCNRQVLNSSNKIKTVWDITKSVTGKFTKVDTIQELKVNGQVISNRQDVADSLNSFFLSVAKNNTNKNFKTNSKPLRLLVRSF
jgi:hypothetical protein